jgi:sigma-B regulation protein RsbU (phosphoserine phosphatase)
MKHALFGTLPGRAIVASAAMKLVALAIALTGRVPAVISVLDTVATIALVAAGVYLLVRGAAFTNRRLLWRVRRKLIISYIFIGFVPAILIVAFFLLGGLLLFSNFSSYLVQNRLRTLADRAQSIAQTTAVDIQRMGRLETASVITRRQAEAAHEFPGLSFAVLRTSGPCHQQALGEIPDDVRAPGVLLATAGDWAHVAAPSAIPGWITCEGFKGLLATDSSAKASTMRPLVGRPAINLTGFEEPVNIVVRAVDFSEAEGDNYAVVVDVPVGPQLIDRLKRETGVALTEVVSIDPDVRPLPSRTAEVAPNATAAANLPVTSVAFLDYVDWASGRRLALRAGIRMNVGETYDRIAAAEGGAGRGYGQSLLLVLVVIGILFLIIEALALVVGSTLARSITGSVHELFAGTERVRAGDFTHKIAIRARDQLGDLAQSFNSMTASIEDLLREQAEKKRLEEELRIAHEIQMSLLPQGPLRMPGLSVTALSVPAREVGGDYYDFLPLDDHRVGVLIADVSGKGTSAALYMAELKGLVLSLSRIHTSPRDLLIMANRIIAEHLDARSFITMTYAVLDLHARTITYARAGHTPLMYLPAAGTPGRHLTVLAPEGLVVGLKIDKGEMFERLLREETMTIHPGDLFLLFTDGITEAMNVNDDCFGEVRLAQLIEEHAHLPSDELRERVLREVAAFVGGAPQHDDMTMILLRIGDIGEGRGHDAAAVDTVAEAQIQTAGA